MKIQFNGKEIIVKDDCRNIIIDKDKIIVNGEYYMGNSPSNIKIVIEGNVESLTAKVGSVEVNGNVGKIDCGGSVSCDSVKGNIKCGGSLNCDDIEGDVQANGSINANNITNFRKR